jgi:V8-like Glu-specific endopeptidase
MPFLPPGPPIEHRAIADCSKTGSETYHACDTYEGMSGAPVLDSANRIRGVHHGAYELTPEVTVNSFATLSKFFLDTLGKWMKQAGA